VDPQKLLDYLLQSRVLTLDSEILAVYLQAVTKIFGVWAANMADRWSDDDLPRVKTVVESLMERIQPFVSSPDIEVQERAANTLQLLTFVGADLNAFKPSAVPSDMNYEDVAAASGSTAVSPSEPRFPKSLYLIRPLSTSYELRPVAPQAQASVPVPEGLDLQAWIVPPPKEEVEIHEEGDEHSERKVKKSKKGKTKALGGSKARTKKTTTTRTDEDGSNGDILVPTVQETEAEKAERERVKAERMERMKDDPYYLTDARQGNSTNQDDVDSIPVVHLDDLPPMSQFEAVNSDLPKLKNNVSEFTRQTFVIDKIGEMPQGAVSPPIPAQIPRESSTPSIGNGGTGRSTPLSSFPQYEVEDEISRTSTPPPIKVTRVKKKTRVASGSGSGKKKRTADPESRSSQ